MKYVIIGAVAGGASTAARLRRLEENANIVLFEKGAYISYANCGLPYYIGDVIKDRNKLFVQTAASFRSRFNIDVRPQSEVTEIKPADKKVVVCNLQTGEFYEETYDKLVLSPGAEPIRPPLPGIDTEGIFTLRSVTDTDLIKTYVQQKRSGKAVVIGAGFIGLEMAENLHKLGLQVSIVEMANQIMAPLDYPMAALVQQHIESKGVLLYLQNSVTGYAKTATGIEVSLQDGQKLDADIVILSIGVKPDTRLAFKAGLEIGNARGIKVNQYLQTSNPDIYAVGDAIEFDSPITGLPTNTYLAGPANKQGRICANNIVLGNVQEYKGAIGTAIVKIFDMTVGAAGVSSKHLKQTFIEHVVSTTHSGSHAGYYPGAQQMSIQLAFDPVSGRLLGAQVVGYTGADKRLDLLASVIKRNSTVYELTEIEHAYAPPYSSAKDPVNMAGFVAENILLNRFNIAYRETLEARADDSIILDVRTPTEFAAAHIPGAINIPVDDLRLRLGELDNGKTIYIYCQIGLRGYLAQRILVQRGYGQVFNLSGGFLLWNAVTAQKNKLKK